MENQKTLTPASLALFIELAKDAGNWSGTPMIDLHTVEQKGNLTHLKRAKLLTTFVSDGCKFASFTPAGRELAKEHGVEID